jgi:hypothetical protein
MSEVFLLVILVCDNTGCYQHRLYSQTEYATKDQCWRQPRILELHPTGTDLKFACMTPDEWAKTPKYPGYAPQR